MHLELGRFGFDIATRPLAMAIVQAITAEGSAVDRDLIGAHLAAVVAHRPAIVELVMYAAASPDALASAQVAIGDIAKAFDGPVVIRTRTARLAHAALRGGAAAIHDPSGLADPDLLTEVVDASASVIIGCPETTDDPVSFLRERVAWATAGGIAATKIVVDAPAEFVGSLQHLGVAQMIQTGNEPEAQGVHVKAVMAGARIIAGQDVVATRRTIDAVGELLTRRHAESGLSQELSPQE